MGPANAVMSLEDLETHHVPVNNREGWGLHMVHHHPELLNALDIHMQGKLNVFGTTLADNAAGEPCFLSANACQDFDSSSAAAWAWIPLLNPMNTVIPLHAISILTKEFPLQRSTFATL